MSGIARRIDVDIGEVRWAAVVFALALALRLIAVGMAHPDPRDGRFDDSVWYDTAARHLAAGDGYVFDPTVWVTADGTRIYPSENSLSPTALWPPGYPVALAAVYAVTDDSLWAGRLFNVLCGALTTVLVFLIARRIFGRTPGAVAGAIFALYPGHVLFTPLLMSETFFLLLMTATLATFVYFVLGRRRPTLVACAGTGLLAGVTAMTRGEFILFPVILLALLAMHLGWRRSVAPAAALLIAAAALFVPWAIRNAVQMGEPIAGTTGAGRVALQGHSTDSDGTPSLTVVAGLDAKYADLSRKERELKTNREGSRIARNYALHHPLDELRLIPRRMLGLFKSDEAAVAWTQSNKPWYGDTGADRLIRLSSFFFFGTIALALAAWPLWWRTRDPARLLLFAPVPYYMFMFGVVFIGDPRYHFGMYPTLAILASVAIVALGQVVRDEWAAIAGGKSFRAVITRYGSRSA